MEPRAGPHLLLHGRELAAEKPLREPLVMADTPQVGIERSPKALAGHTSRPAASGGGHATTQTSQRQQSMARLHLIANRTMSLSVGDPEQSELCESIGNILADWCRECLGASHWVVLRWNQIDNLIQFVKGSETVGRETLESAWHDKKVRLEYFFQTDRPSGKAKFVRVIRWSDPGFGPDGLVKTKPKSKGLVQKAAESFLMPPDMEFDPAPSCTGIATFPIGDVPFTVFFALPATSSIPTVEQLEPAYERVLGICHNRCLRGRRELAEDEPPERPTRLEHLIHKVFKAAEEDDESVRVRLLEECINSAISSQDRVGDFQVMLHKLVHDGKVFSDLEVKRLDNYEAVVDKQSIRPDQEPPRSIAAFAAKKKVSFAISDLNDHSSPFIEKLAGFHLHPNVKNTNVGISGYLVAVPPEAKVTIQARGQLGLVGEKQERFVCTGESANEVPDIGRRLRTVQRLLTLYHSLRDVRLISKHKADYPFRDG